ncbi:hypothetical protein FUAX_40710 (plasmid) [Fulvitalea axinellae]|uniref:Nucleotidyltransferase n=1 Tax=Fulvitalea axinellae TaxID=1182444 RepID=A0AAU9CHJ0_9BACT|nr:hypothetical protein FUAX_32870 [Fulvitalea axinellae]BDD11639.1 hypothetical protein FUAX_40710 [Fulvitalea axinellae]
MARSITQIQQSILTAKEAEPGLATLDSPKKVAEWRLWAYVVAVAIWALEKLMDAHRAEVAEIAERFRPHNIRWYREQCLGFLDGLDLVWDGERYAQAVSEGEEYRKPTEEETEDLAVIRRCAVVEGEEVLVIKVATEENGTVQPLSQEQYTRFSAYMNKVKDAGNRLDIVNNPPDDLRMRIWIRYNPLVMSPDGSLVTDPRAFPVNEAVTTYLANLDFNGDFVNTDLLDRIQKAEGVSDVTAVRMEARYGGLDWFEFKSLYSPFAGYLAIAGEWKAEPYTVLDNAGRELAIKALADRSENSGAVIAYEPDI